MTAVWYWLLHLAGIDNLAGPWYGFWSGLGSDLGELAIVGGLAGVYIRHNCHVRGCWRVGRHRVEGSPHVVCGRHHPEGAPTHAHILSLHRRAKARPDAGEDPHIHPNPP